MLSSPWDFILKSIIFENDKSNYSLSDTFIIERILNFNEEMKYQKIVKCYLDKVNLLKRLFSNIKKLMAIENYQNVISEPKADR